MEDSNTSKTILIILFAIIGAALIAGAMWYAGNVLNAAPVAEPAQPSAPSSTDTGLSANTNQNTTTNPMNELKINDLTVGTGTIAQNGDQVTVNYTGTFDNGKVFDSSLNPGRTPFVFTLGAGQVIKGWDLGVLGMRVGGTRELVIPSSLGYGPNDYGPIPGGSTLHFKIELLAVSTSSAQ